MLKLNINSLTVEQLHPIVNQLLTVNKNLIKRQAYLIDFTVKGFYYNEIYNQIFIFINATINKDINYGFGKLFTDAQIELHTIILSAEDYQQLLKQSF